MYMGNQKGFVPLVAILVITFISLGGVSVVSQNSLPGDIRYPLKEAKESLRINLAFNNQFKARVYLDLAAEKGKELEKLQQSGASEDKILQVIKKLQTYQQKAAEALGEATEKGEDVAEEMVKLEEETKKQQQILNEVLESSSEETKKTVQEVIDSTQQSIEDVIPQNSSSEDITNINQSNPQQPTTAPIPTNTPTIASVPTATPIPTQAPTTAPTPTSAPEITSPVYIVAYQHAGNQDYTISNAKVIVKNKNNGQQLGYGFTDSSGRSPTWNVPKDTNVEVYLYPPNSPNTPLCGDYWTFNSGLYGTLYSQNMRIKENDGGVCIKE